MSNNMAINQTYGREFFLQVYEIIGDMARQDKKITIHEITNEVLKNESGGPKIDRAMMINLRNRINRIIHDLKDAGKIQISHEITKKKTYRLIITQL